jgi:UDP-N-acetylglucosamine--N-acetylmuramyl-(pentapeptide) pyrophosphoryl-undecaprenol N-acetylglucosamine transferase
MKIVFSGGHHNAALEVAKNIKISRPEIKIIWYGHKHTTLSDNSLSAEYKEVTSAGITFRNINAGKVYKTYNIKHWIRLPLGFFQSLWYLMKDRPCLIVSFGGYLAVPIVLAGRLQGIPSVTHEQTCVAGLANRFIAKFAKKVFITWPNSEVYFNKKKTIITGLPLRTAIFSANPKEFAFDNSLPTIYVTGGKQGSHVINMAVKDALPQIIKIANVIHQTGSSTEYNDFQALEEVRGSLAQDLKKRYILRQYVFEDEIGSVFSKADIIVSRSGAHMIYELIALKKPALLIPIPWSSHNEQYKNAEMLKREGGADILEQTNLSSSTLYEYLTKMIGQAGKYKSSAEKNTKIIKLDALDIITREILKLV